jgi:hypothetical protein
MYIAKYSMGQYFPDFVPQNPDVPRHVLEGFIKYV